MERERKAKLEAAAKQLASALQNDMGQLRTFALLKGIKLNSYTDFEIVQVIARACEIYMGGARSFEFKPVYQK